MKLKNINLYKQTKYKKKELRGNAFQCKIFCPIFEPVFRLEGSGYILVLQSHSIVSSLCPTPMRLTAISLYYYIPAKSRLFKKPLNGRPIDTSP